jgi:hypothetical protein
MALEQTTTVDLLRMLTSRDARKRAWKPRSWGSYSDSSDESMLCDIIDTLAKRIDGKECGPETRDPLEGES